MSNSDIVDERMHPWDFCSVSFITVSLLLVCISVFGSMGKPGIGWATGVSAGLDGKVLVTLGWNGIENWTSGNRTWIEYSTYFIQYGKYRTLGISSECFSFW